MDGAEIQGWLLNSGQQKLYCGKAYDLAVDMNRGQGRGHRWGFGAIVKAAKVDILGNGYAQPFEGKQRVHGDEVICANKNVWKRI